MKSFYVSFSIILTNLIMLFLGVNLIIFIYSRLAHEIPHWLAHVSHQPKPPSLDVKLHPGWTQPEIAKLNRETWTTVKIRSYDYDEITQLRLRSVHGQYVNVENGGFRRIRNQGPWPLDPSALNLFVLGGSTAFGFLMDDDHTIPSYLQEFARAASKKHVNVYNFGRPGYMSTQELLLYLALLRDEHVPNVAIFIDGLNDCQEWTPTPIYDSQWPDAYVYSAIEAQKKGIGYMILQRAPMTGLSGWIASKLGLNHLNEIQPNPAAIQAFIVKRWLKNKKAIEALSSAYGVKVAFVWQPAAAYKYDLKYDSIAPENIFASELFVPVIYPVVETMADRGFLGPNFLNLAEIQQGKTEDLYVDPWHYNDAFSREIASKIQGFLQEKKLLE
jgi:hypothetical protein